MGKKTAIYNFEINDFETFNIDREVEFKPYLKYIDVDYTPTENIICGKIGKYESDDFYEKTNKVLFLQRFEKGIDQFFCFTKHQIYKLISVNSREEYYIFKLQEMDPIDFSKPRKIGY